MSAQSPPEDEARAASLLQRGKCDDAIAIYNGLILLGSPWDAAAYHNRGIAWIKKGDKKHAIFDFDEAIRLDPQCPDSFSSRSGCWLSLGSYSLALADADAAIRLAPPDFLGYQKRAAVWLATGHHAAALADYDRALQFGPGVASTYRYRAWFFVTCPDPRFRDGLRAFEDAWMAYSLRGVTGSDIHDPEGPNGAASMEALAAAAAEYGDFAAAEQWEQKVLDGMISNDAGYMRVARRVKLYHSGERYCQQPKMPDVMVPIAAAQPSANPLPPPPAEGDRGAFGSP